jgi:hypothetical protein
MDEMVPEDSKNGGKNVKTAAAQKPPPEAGISQGLPPGYTKPGDKAGGAMWRQGGSGGGGLGGSSTTAAPGGRNSAFALATKPAQAGSSGAQKAAFDPDMPMLSGDAAHQAVAETIQSGSEADGLVDQDGSGSMASNTKPTPCPKNATNALVRKLTSGSTSGN